MQLIDFTIESQTEYFCQVNLSTDGEQHVKTPSRAKLPSWTHRLVT